jgi:hypothetical protein
MTPTFWLDEDGEHVWWSHVCVPGSFDFYDNEIHHHPEPARMMLPIGETGWSVDSIDPITVRPSILCRRCNTHGFITNGQWVAA